MHTQSGCQAGPETSGVRVHSMCSKRPGQCTFFVLGIHLRSACHSLVSHLRVSSTAWLLFHIIQQRQAHSWMAAVHVRLPMVAVCVGSAGSGVSLDDQHRLLPGRGDQSVCGAGAEHAATHAALVQPCTHSLHPGQPKRYPLECSDWLGMLKAPRLLPHFSLTPQTGFNWVGTLLRKSSSAVLNVSPLSSFARHSPHIQCTGGQ